MENALEIPEGITVKVEGSEISAAGKLGELKKTFADPNIDISMKDNKIVFSAGTDTRKQKRMINTFVAEVKNMFKGVTEGYTYKMKVVFTHFPTTVKVEGKKVRIDNFLGERAPRFAKAFEGVEIKVNKQDIDITGTDKYAVSQTAANIEQACRVGNRDRRVFQDGVYITGKDVKAK